MSGATACNCPFRGALAILASRRRRIQGVALLAGLLPGLGAGGLLLLGRAPEGGERAARDLVGFFCWAGAVAFPVLCAWVDALVSTQVGTRSRREELLSLPIGKLAIPAAGLASAVIGTIAGFALFFAGLSLTNGPGLVLGALLDPEGLSPLVSRNVALSQAMAFTAATAFASFAQHPASAVVIWSVFPGLLFVAGQGMGYAPAERDAYLALWNVTLIAFYLAVPFVLYAGPAHRWATERGARQDAGWALLAVFLALAALALLGAGPVMAAILATGALWLGIGRLRAPRVERPARSAIAVANVLALLAIAPVAIFGLVTDAERMAESARFAGKKAGAYAVSPDGRRVAIFMSHGATGFALPGMRAVETFFDIARVAVVDLEAGGPPVVLEPRFTDFPAGAWSRDGRYIAVRDRGFGRLCMLNPRYRSRPDTVLGALARELMEHGDTVVHDTRTGRTERLDAREVAPGWTEPRDLVRIAYHPRGGYAFANGRGVAARLDVEDRPMPQVDRYEGDAAFISAGKRHFRLSPAGLAELTGDAAGWQVEATVRPPKTQEKNEARLEVACTRGAEKLVLPGLRSLVWRGEDAIVVKEASNDLVRVALPGGERRILVPAVEVGWAHAPFAWPWPEEPRIFVGRAPKKHFLLDPRSGARTPLPDAPGFFPEVLAGKRAIGTDLAGGPLLVRDLPDGPIRPVVAPAAE